MDYIMAGLRFHVLGTCGSLFVDLHVFLKIINNATFILNFIATYLSIAYNGVV